MQLFKLLLITDIEHFTFITLPITFSDLSNVLKVIATTVHAILKRDIISSSDMLVF